jgi:aldehyde dehydrogenase (NAD+)
LIGEVGEGNRKDVRNAVEAANAAAATWGFTHGHSRAQIMYYIAENLSARAGEFAARISHMTGGDWASAFTEVEKSIQRLFYYAAWADKYDGMVHNTPLRGVVMAIPEPLGVAGVLCPDEAPLLGMVSLLAPLMAMGNTAVVVPSTRYPLSATDFYQVLETSDVPPGVVNIITGSRETLAKTLAEHDDVQLVWYFDDSPENAGKKMVEIASAANLKRVWIDYASRNGPRDWLQDNIHTQGSQFLREASQVKNIWTPYGE